MSGWHNSDELMLKVTVDKDGLLRRIAEIEVQVESLNRTVAGLKDYFKTEEHTVKEESTVQDI